MHFLRSWRSLIAWSESCELDLSAVTSTVISTSDTRHAKAVVSAATWLSTGKAQDGWRYWIKGRTTVTTMIMASLREAGYRAASIGSNGVNLGDEVLGVANWHLTLTRCRANFLSWYQRYRVRSSRGCSSQGLMQHRTDTSIGTISGVFLSIQHGDHVGTDEHHIWKLMHIVKPSAGVIQSRWWEYWFHCKMQHVILLLSVMMEYIEKTDKKLSSRPDYVISRISHQECGSLSVKSFTGWV